MGYVDLAERFVAARFPKASVAVIGGSTSRGERTPTSDIDLLLIGDDLLLEGKTGAALTEEFEGEIFEVFAYTPQGFDEWAQRSVTQHRPVIVHMLVEGTPVRAGDELATLRDAWSERLDRGPSVDAHELDFRRYVITDVLDDLRDATDPLERRVIAATLFERTAELMLLTAGRWIGTGKYLPRRLRELPAERVDALVEPYLNGNVDELADAVERELAVAGGRLQAGFVR
ncbi:nucleotidyltransferase domain-containing protein [Microbacterium sp. YMB-B2]|uniref:Nucleotidyltransferase domain-containing protein n=1 Tax=Microbacterium tenebrionis TaxID=2830665 RepID=A0A9X1LPH5_9MICO|nr:nucleotidyltransferase domain-containing protein [Microbacterium tenebrionis]MCC2029255.1 nucleotidyltransferase domain-containing protein [Microbacterium tenebrionis]